MKFVLAYDSPICREYGKNVSDIIEKMYVLEDNKDFIIDKLAEQYPKDTVFDGHNPARLKQLIVQIACYLDCANDEFYLEDVTEQISIYLELETKEVAELNDQDFLSDVSEEELKDYQVGDGNYSYYTRLGDTDYYFRFM